MGDNLMKEWFKENKWIFVGGIVIVVAILTPLILFIVRNHLDQKTFEALGPVGDFFGGTTVGLLTLASMLFVIASISMQRKQLDMQQDELKMQREELSKTREEFELTNKTLTKQQFESTFFNMINLHHNLLKDLKGGRQYLEDINIELSGGYSAAVNKYWKNKLYSLKNIDLNKFDDFLLSMDLFEKSHSQFKDRFQNIIRSDIHHEIDLNKNFIEALQQDINDAIHIEARSDENLIRQIKMFNDASLIERYFKLNYIEQYLKNKHYEIRVTAYHDYTINIEEIYSNLKNEWATYLKKTREETLIKPLYSLKKTAYENIYKEHEEQIGHYYRNLYRIMKFIQDEHFSNNSKDNEKEKKKYRGILRAQLSSMELLMLFYNVVYSEKGQKFKAILKGTNFFDDHLIESKFLWANDKEELAALK